MLFNVCTFPDKGLNLAKVLVLQFIIDFLFYFYKLMVENII